MRAPTEQSIAAGEVLLSVEDVSLSFGGVKAVSGVSFDIRKGEIRAIIGPNGAGKTSMLNIINGFYQPQHGRITFKGETRSTMRPNEAARGGMARTFQNVALFKGMTALDNLMAGRTLQGKTIGYIYFDGGYGLEPIRCSTSLPRISASRSRNIRSRLPTCRTSPGSGSTCAETGRIG